MVYDKTKPIDGTLSDADLVRNNMNELAAHHRRATPPADPELGWIFIDTSDPFNHKLKVYTEPTGSSSSSSGSPYEWVTMIEHLESIPVPTTLPGGANAGDLKIFDGNDWNDRQLAVGQVDYLVGPAGQAKYTSIQVAVDQAVTDGYGTDANNAASVWILPGTYVGNINLPPWIYLRAVDLFTGLAGANKARVTIDGTVTCDKTDAGATYYAWLLAGVYIDPSSGPAIVESGTARKAITLSESAAQASDADTLSLGGTAQLCGISLQNSSLSSTGAGRTCATIPANYSVTGYAGSMVNVWFDNAARTAKLDGGQLTLIGTHGQSGSVLGTIEVLSSGAGSVLRLHHMELSPLLNPSQVIVNASLGASSYFENTYKGGAQQIVISGTNASEFKEIPGGSAGDIWQYDGDRWQITGMPALTASNEDMTCSVTSSDGDAATATAMAATPSGAVRVFVNGDLVSVGDGVKTKFCYFSDDGGTTARAQGAIVATDTCHWNGSIAGYELDANDRITFVYEV